MNVSPGSVVPLAVGFGLIAALVFYEYTIGRPLMPIRAATSAVPLAGIVITLAASAAAFGLMEMGIEALAHSGPAHSALAFLLEFVPAVALIGMGAAASVSPALFMVGFSLPALLLQRVFALVELLRGVTAFLVAPVLAFLAATLSGGEDTRCQGRSADLLCHHRRRSSRRGRCRSERPAVAGSARP